MARSTLESANFEGANLTNTEVAYTYFIDTDVSPFCDAVPPVVHAGPSTVDYRSIVKARNAVHLKGFLQKTGMPEVFAEYIVSCAVTLDMDVTRSMLRTIFISYGGPDEAFARKLYGRSIATG